MKNNIKYALVNTFDNRYGKTPKLKSLMEEGKRFVHIGAVGVREGARPNIYWTIAGMLLIDTYNLLMYNKEDGITTKHNVQGYIVNTNVKLEETNICINTSINNVNVTEKITWKFKKERKFFEMYDIIQGCMNAADDVLTLGNYYLDKEEVD